MAWAMDFSMPAARAIFMARLAASLGVATRSFCAVPCSRVVRLRRRPCGFRARGSRLRKFSVVSALAPRRTSPRATQRVQRVRSPPTAVLVLGALVARSGASKAGPCAAMRIEQANRAAPTRVGTRALKKADQNARETRFDGLGFGLDAFHWCVFRSTQARRIASCVQHVCLPTVEC